MKTIQITLLLFLLSFSGIAQEVDHIEVTGIAEKEIVPNEVYISITLNERLEKGKKVTIEQLENELKKDLVAIGVSAENLSISNLNSHITKISWWREKVLASAVYELKITESSKLKDVFNAFESLKIKEAKITKATHSKIKELKKEVRIEAIKTAKEKADYLLKAIGQQTGKPIKITENGNLHQSDFTVANYSSNNSSYMRSEAISKVRADSGSVQFKKMKLISSIYIKFRIK